MKYWETSGLEIVKSERKKNKSQDWANEIAGNKGKQRELLGHEKNARGNEIDKK